MNLSMQYVVAHRGASAFVKFDNTLDAFTKAIELGAEIIEFDIRRTGDGVLISYHDDCIEGKLLRECSYADVEKIANNMGFSIPKLDEVLLLIKGKACLDIELKEAGYEKQIVKEITQHYDYKDFMIKSFYDGVIREIKVLDSNITTGLILGLDKKECSDLLKTRLSELYPSKRLRKAGCDFVSPNYKLLKLGFVKRMKNMGMPILVWTVNDYELMKRLFMMGINGIITDRVDMGLQAISEINKLTI